MLLTVFKVWCPRLSLIARATHVIDAPFYATVTSLRFRKGMLDNARGFESCLKNVRYRGPLTVRRLNVTLRSNVPSVGIYVLAVILCISSR